MNIFFEMKLIAFVNLRVGPNRIGPWGTLASVIHGLKVLAKEDFTPTGADVPVFTLAPAVVYLAAVMTLLVVPFAPGLFGYDMDIGLLYFFAVGGLGVVGPDDGRLVELQQVLAAGRPARRGRDHQLRAAAHPQRHGRIMLITGTLT